MTKNIFDCTIEATVNTHIQWTKTILNMTSRRMTCEVHEVVFVQLCAAQPRAENVTSVYIQVVENNLPTIYYLQDGYELRHATLTGVST